jgi:hypothetical protein
VVAKAVIYGREMSKFSQWFYNSMYRHTKARWDTGVTLPEVTPAIDQCDRPGRAIHLAQHGWPCILFESAFAFSSMWPTPQRDRQDVVWYDLTRR